MNRIFNNLTFISDEEPRYDLSLTINESSDRITVEVSDSHYDEDITPTIKFSDFYDAFTSIYQVVTEQRNQTQKNILNQNHTEAWKLNKENRLRDLNTVLDFMEFISSKKHVTPTYYEALCRALSTRDVNMGYVANPEGVTLVSSNFILGERRFATKKDAFTFFEDPYSPEYFFNPSQNKNPKYSIGMPGIEYYKVSTPCQLLVSLIHYACIHNVQLSICSHCHRIYSPVRSSHRRYCSDACHNLAKQKREKEYKPSSLSAKHRTAYHRIYKMDDPIKLLSVISLPFQHPQLLADMISAAKSNDKYAFRDAFAAASITAQALIHSNELTEKEYQKWLDTFRIYKRND